MDGSGCALEIRRTVSDESGPLDDEKSARLTRHASHSLPLIAAIAINEKKGRMLDVLTARTGTHRRTGAGGPVSVK